ncbi:hypothetical protein REPUB_Repub11eG0036100 [Reevesia pubescens]
MARSGLTNQAHISHRCQLRWLFRFEGRKYDLAKKFKTVIINHRWIEDCIKEGKRLPDDPYNLQSGEEIGPLLLEIPDVAKRDALIKKCKVFSDKSNVCDEVRNKPSDVCYGGSGWSKAAMLVENHFPGLRKSSSCELKSKPFKRSLEEHWLSSRNCFQATNSTGLARKHGESSSYASMIPTRNERKISKNKEPNSHCSTQLLREERNIPNDSDQECYPPMVHKQYSGVINLSDHSLERTVSLSEIGGPSNYDFSKHMGVDEEVEEIKLWNHQPPS